MHNEFLNHKMETICSGYGKRKNIKYEFPPDKTRFNVAGAKNYSGMSHVSCTIYSFIKIYQDIFLLYLYRITQQQSE